MESALIFKLMLAFCGIISISSKKLTDKELKEIFDRTVDMEEFVDNIFTLPAPQQLYVYEYLQDLIKNLEKDSKMTKFINASLKLLQKKVDDFNEEKKLQKVSVIKFIQKRINAQLKAPYKKTDSSKATKKPPSSSETPSTVDKPGNNSQPGSTKNNIELKTDDPKSRPKISEKTPLLDESTNPRNSYLLNAGTLLLTKNPSTKLDKKDPADEKNSLSKSKSDSSESTKKPSSSKKDTSSATPSPSPIANDKKSLPSPNSMQMNRKIQPPMSTNPLNFILRFDKPDSKDLKKPSLKPEPEPSKPVNQSAPSKEKSSKPPTPTNKKQTSKKPLPSTNTIETPQKIQTPLQATSASSKNLPTLKPKSPQTEVKQPKPDENLMPIEKSKITAQSQGEKSSLVKSPKGSGAKSPKSPKSLPKNQKASPAAATEGFQSFSV